MFKLRDYQQDAINNIINHCKVSSDPVVADLCVSSGKTNMISHLIKHVVSKGGRVLAVTHVKELVIDAVETYDNHSDYGICAASLNKKETDKHVTFAMIQTLTNKIKLFPKIDFLIIDECHRINDSNQKTAYMSVVNHLKKVNPKIRIVGLTGTPFRLGTGLLVGKKRLFKKIIATVYIKDLLKLGFVAKPVTPHTNIDAYDFSKLEIKHGTYQEVDLNAVTHDERLTKSIVNDIIIKCQERSKVIMFASTLQHAKEIIGYLPANSAVYIDGKLSVKERADVLNRFHHDDSIKFMVNKDLLGTGYSFPEISCVAILRPTESLALLIQLIGRGLRIKDGKENCLILDYASNFIDIDSLLDNEGIKSIAPRDKQDQDKIICPDCGTFCNEGARRCKCGFWFVSKECTECQTENDITARHCLNCEAELVDPNNALCALSSGAEAFRAKVINYSLSTYNKNKKCLRVDYIADDVINKQPNISAFYAQGTGHLKHWIKHHLKPGFDPNAYLDNVDNIVRYQNDFNLPTVITYKKNGKYFNLCE